MPKTSRFFLGLGSNRGDRRKNLSRARDLLERSGVRIRRASSLYRTQPVGYARQRWFYNQVLEVEASLSPFDLLDTVQDVERLMKRRPSFHNGPRRIDIDILLAGKTVVLTRSLVIPHPRLALRNFVLWPLREIAPNAVHPILREDVATLCEESKDRSVVRKIRTRQPDFRVSSPAHRRPGA